jgi:hypothetical protein
MSLSPEGGNKICDVGDHTHPVTIDDGGPVCTTGFDFGALDPEIPNLIPMDTVTSGFVKILGWMQSGADLRSVAARVLALDTFLNPVHAKYQSLSEISQATGISRAALSRALLNLHDDYGLRWCMRVPGTREHCASAQKLALQNGHHASFKTRKNPIAQRENIAMNASTEPKTLDAAKQRIRALEQELSRRDSKPDQPGQRETKPGPAAAPQLSDLNRNELLQVLSIANHDGNTDLVRSVYAELKRR